MDQKKSTYKTVRQPSKEVLLKEKKSKFYGYTFPVESEDDIKSILEELRKLHPSANHVCYAWQLGVEQMQYRANDDGEPNNSAGMPIYGQIQSFEVTNILVAVVRLFGGTKLGVGGLITAYKETAKLALENSNIIKKVLKEQITLSYEYEEMDAVMRFIKKHQLNIVAQNLNLKCETIVSVRKDQLVSTLKSLKALHKIKAKKTS